MGNGVDNMMNCGTSLLVIGTSVKKDVHLKIMNNKIIRISKDKVFGMWVYSEGFCIGVGFCLITLFPKYKCMADKKILERGGTQDDINQYSKLNGAGLTNKDLLIKESVENLDKVLEVVDSPEGYYRAVKELIVAEISKAWEAGRKYPIPANDDCNHEEYLYGRCVSCGVCVE